MLGPQIIKKNYMNMSFISENKKESPLNYSGSKYKILDFLFENTPKDTNRFIDIFGGGFNVGINAPYPNIIYNDYCDFFSMHCSWRFKLYYS